MKPLGFRIERIAYHPSSGLTGDTVQKIRDDGRIGAATADELALWDALVEANHRCLAMAEQVTDLDKENVELKRQLESRRAKK